MSRALPLHAIKPAVPEAESRDAELTILMPCLNEAETIATCIDKAHGFLARSGVAGEIRSRTTARATARWNMRWRAARASSP
jgi:hypothetical protein